MPTDDSSAELTTIDGVPTLRFERRLAHPPERVWRAVSEPAQLAAWFPAAVETELRPGAPMRFTFGDQAPVDDSWDGEVLEVDPPKAFMFRWNRDVLRFELIAEPPGCRLVFTHALGHGTLGRLGAARTAAGWDGCLTALAAVLDGVDPGSPQERWLTRAQAYVEKFGLGRGRAETDADGRTRLRFTHDLVPQTAEGAWAVLVEHSRPRVGAMPPERAANPVIEPGPLTAAQPPGLLEYEATVDSVPAGRVRWEIIADPDTGTRLELVHTLPHDLGPQRARLLAAWQVHLELFYAANRGEIRCPWPAQRVTDLTATYADA
ncbi:SRPBCC family protein [Nocardia spumae]|uniref:SRPBCC family protein n=1 Tax=Nocardia spumae TaxID=2887190 RepID=UPI001D146423|nr:SRPBCC family protein [Nocardia spumae]